MNFGQNQPIKNYLSGIYSIKSVNEHLKSLHRRLILSVPVLTPL